MRTLILVVCLAAIPVMVMADDYKWHGPGWYQVISNQYGSAIGPGPFTTKDSCERTLPKNDKDRYIEYECNYLDKDGLTDK